MMLKVLYRFEHTVVHMHNDDMDQLFQHYLNIVFDNLFDYPKWSIVDYSLMFDQLNELVVDSLVEFVECVADNFEHYVVQFVFDYLSMVIDVVVHF